MNPWTKFCNSLIDEPLKLLLILFLILAFCG
jgi:hypothetical protein